MKKTLKSAGAVGLAAATILTGLSFGPAAANAVSTTKTEFRMVFESANGQYLSVGSANDGVRSAYFSDSAEALSRAATYEYDSATKLVRVTAANQANKCWLINDSFGTGFLDVINCNSQDVRQQFTPSGTGGFISALHPSLRINTATAYAGMNFPRFSSGDEAVMVSGLRTFHGEVSTYDLHARTATLSGKAVPGSKVIINGDLQVVVDDDGTWSATMSGLALGVNTLTLEQYEGTDKTDEITLEVDLAVKPVTATAAFDTDVTKEAVLSGTAHPGAIVVVEDADGTEIDRAPASPIDGT